MRFTEDGPSIPDALLEARDRGEVIFLCGAGVSAPAGLPMFGDLARRVVDRLGALAGHPARRELAAGDEQALWDGVLAHLEGAFTPDAVRAAIDAAAEAQRQQGRDDPTPHLVSTASGGTRLLATGRTRFDRVFSLLEEAYPPDKVRAEVEAELTPRGEGGGEHEVVARLSSDAAGRPRLVTTNFDRLFGTVPSLAERPVHTPERLPDPTAAGSWDGVVHLHGALGHGASELVLSEAAFGRAYLAPPAPAASFMAGLLEHHVVVLLGYRAEDPPMEYLLQGLRRAGADQRPLHAFVSGGTAEDEAIWLRRGVTPIFYGENHERLWETLRLWADRADDPAAWRHGVAAQAAAGPRTLAHHERGQVAHLVRSTEGARAFVEADPPAPAEWLCVLDRARRRAEPRRSVDERLFSSDNAEPTQLVDELVIDPLDLYGLDADPPRRPNEWLGPRNEGDHLLAWREGDDRPVDGFALADLHPELALPLPRRLNLLAWWIAARLDEPAAAWWLARQTGLHPAVADAVRRRLDRRDLPKAAMRTIRLALEAATGGRDENLALMRLRGRVGREGWTPPCLEELRRLARPRVRLRHGPTDVCPPTGTWEEAADQVGPFDVDLPNPNDDGRLAVPDEDLVDVCRVMTDALRLLVWRLGELGHPYFRLAAFTPDDRPGRRWVDRTSWVVHWVAGLLDRLAEHDPAALRAEAAIWPRDEPHVFDRLRWHVWRHADAFPGPVLSALVAALLGSTVWDIRHRRNAMLMLAARWSDLDEATRSHLEAVLLAGDDEWADAEDGTLRREREAAVTLWWLQGQGCALSGKTASALKDLIARQPQWDNAWAAAAVADHDGRSWGVGIDTDPGDLATLPLADIVREAETRMAARVELFTEPHPFQGLIMDQPTRALAALRHQERRGQHPDELWRELLNAWPETAGPRGHLLLAATLAAMPSSRLAGLVDYLPRVFEGVLPRLWDRASATTLSLLDGLLTSLLEAADRGELADDGGRPGSTHAALGSPFGWAAEFLLRRAGIDGATEDAASPSPEVLERMEGLLRLPGAATNAAVMFGTRMACLQEVDPGWTTRVLRPLFDRAHPLAEGAWTGLLHRLDLVDEPLLRDLAPDLLTLFPWPPSWSAEPEAPKRAAKLLVLARLPVQERQAPITAAQARTALQHMTDLGRGAAIRQLDAIAFHEPEMWTGFVVPFLRDAWPLETALRTPRTVRALVELATGAGEAFPSVAEIVRARIAPVVAARDDLLWRFGDDTLDDGPGLARRHPRATLLLLDAALRREETSGFVRGDEVLDTIAEVEPSLRARPEFHSLAAKLGRG